MYDVVWYSPERVADVDRVLTRLTVEECTARNVPGDLVMSSPGVPIPGQDVLGRCVCRNCLGASDTLPLGNTAYMASICDLTAHGTGLVGGTLTADFLLSPEMESGEGLAAEREAMLRARVPWRFGQCLRYTWLTFVAMAASIVMCVRSIPRSLRRAPVKKIRSVGELEREFGRVLVSIVTTRNTHNGR